MKKLFLSLAMLLSFLQVSAQFGGYDPVSMEENVTVKGDEATIEFEALIENGYHLYSTDVPSGGPTPLTVKYHVVEGAELVGDLVPGDGVKREFDPIFEIEVPFFDETASFTQKIKLLGGDYRIEGTLSYQSCGDGQCFMGRYDFEVKGTVEKKAAPAPVKKETPKPIEVKAEPKVEKPAQPVVEPAKETVAEPVAEPVKEVAPVAEPVDTVQAQAPVASVDKNSSEYLWRSVIDELNSFSQEGHSSLWVIFVLGFGAGLIALLTPCVWPIIPMTVSFFLKRSKDRSKAIREAVIYGASIVVIYLLLGVLVTLIFGAGALNALSTSAVFNIFFFLMLVAFGASFLGGFELTLPSSWTNKVDEKASNTTGLLSIFLMAFTLVLVSFSCTGPIIGFMLVSVADTGEILAPSVGMFAFALALALPFTLFALFPSLLKQTPRSGSWMNTIKVVLGFVELAFSLKFLSVADLAYGWGILDRETFLALWIALFLILGLYLLKIIRFPHDESDDTKTSVPGFFAGLVSIAFAIYMIPGLWGAPCKAISAFAPPMKTQDFSLYNNDFKPHTDDYETALRMSQTTGKPVMLDFTGHGCVNCREMEAAVWSDDRVIDIMRNDYIVASLYVDDKTELEKPFKVKGEDGKMVWITTVGEKWTYLQNHKFGGSAQPFYVLVDAYGDPLATSYSYNTDIDAYIRFLEKGIDNYNAAGK
ncbi:MAG: thioredoxin family protein [Bacteroidaceae bacterium]|nr:thioredoxin family protein [Bacteroidaceae bacterium]